MTSEGGPIGGGVLFAMNPDDSSFQVLFDFGSGTRIWASRLPYPLGVQVLRHGPPGGSPRGAGGVIFQINTDGTGFQILHNFMPVRRRWGQPLGDLTFSRSNSSTDRPMVEAPAAAAWFSPIKYRRRIQRLCNYSSWISDLKRWRARLHRARQFYSITYIASRQVRLPYPRSKAQ